MNGEPSADRLKAMEKQRSRGNDPAGTRRTEEVRMDHLGCYRTGLRYRRWLEEKERE